MKIKVPFYKSKKDTDCGLLALKMALAYLGEKYICQKIAKEIRQLDTGLVWSVGVARASKMLGFPTKFISTTNFSHEESDIDYYKKYSDDRGKIILKELFEEIKKIGVEVQERDMPIDELLSYVSENSIPIVLVNWYVISGKEGFSGHFLPISGYDEENIYVHNPGLASAMPYLPIKRNVFLKAWESKGTDKDTIIIYRKILDSLV
ncbi:peptidase C39 family protein [Candidatus Pacearchaeota archaeon]|nr:peptidase C39 family protein [Candidatus Pacearchaeota archaeon]